MLTFSEALMFLKTGEDMRFNSWPADAFVRLANQGTQIPGFIAQEFTPTQAEMLGHEWSKA